MKISHYTKIESQPVEMDGARDTRVRWLIGNADRVMNWQEEDKAIQRWRIPHHKQGSRGLPAM